MTIKERIIDFFHAIREYIDYRECLGDVIVDFAGDTPEEIEENHRKWVENNRFRRRDRDAQKQLSSD